MSEIFIGLMSGTSIDAIDAVLVNFTPKLELIATHSEPIPAALKQSLIEICQPGSDEINRLGQLDVQMGLLFAQAAKNLLQKAHIESKQVRAIGSHGQTVRHQPNLPFPFTLQIGDPNIIAEITGITTIADFRRRDIANGGQGAPLVPAFHNYIFRHPQKDRIILNIGGIANITLLPADRNALVTGFDTGPGNTLLDAWAQKELQQPCDKNGRWAASGKLDKELLVNLLADPYFQKTAPKSTGREYFNLNWLQQKISSALPSEDIQNTLTALTANSIMQAIDNCPLKNCEILVCGGGIHNGYLLQCLEKLKGKHSLHSTQEFGIDPDWVEAIVFAWLAKQTLDDQPGNLPAVTGAKQSSLLGGIYKSLLSNTIKK